METFTPLASTLGGALIGLSASLMLLLHGRIAGISGILGGLLSPAAGDMAWRALFVAGLVSGGLVGGLVAPELFESTITRSPAALVAAGLLVGFGSRLGDGCTSGHGVCGLTRMSVRSAVAVGTLMATGMGTAVLVQQIFGGVF